MPPRRGWGGWGLGFYNDAAPDGARFGGHGLPLTAQIAGQTISAGSESNSTKVLDRNKAVDSLLGDLCHEKLERL